MSLAAYVFWLPYMIITIALAELTYIMPVICSTLKTIRCMKHRNVVLLNFHLDTIKFTRFQLRFDKMFKCNAILTKYPTCVDSGSGIRDCTYCLRNESDSFRTKKNKLTFSISLVTSIYFDHVKRQRSIINDAILFLFHIYFMHIGILSAYMLMNCMLAW